MIEKSSLLDYLRSLLIQVSRINRLGPLGLIDVNPIELDEEESFLIISSDPHRMYEIKHDGYCWIEQDEESIDLANSLNKLCQNPKYSTEIWATQYLSVLGYTIIKNNKVVAMRKDLYEN